MSLANQVAVSRLRRGGADWNEWRKGFPGSPPSLRGADLEGVDLAGANLAGVDLVGARLRGASLAAANLSRARLTEARLEHASLSRANLAGTSLGGAALRHVDFSFSELIDVDLTGAVLDHANFYSCTQHRCEFSAAFVSTTRFINIDLTDARGLEMVRPGGDCIVDHRTLRVSRSLPRGFLRAVGLTDAEIDYLPSLFSPSAIEYASCFISYSHRDESFTTRLYGDLRRAGVQCWYAPEDIKIGDRIDEAIGIGIQGQDKLLLVLSSDSVQSGWVEHEVRQALRKEEKERRMVLFPIRLDDAIEECPYDWATLIRRNRHIGDFRDLHQYEDRFQRLLRDLTNA